MDNMKAVVFDKYGDPEVLKWKEVEAPKIKSNEVLIKVAAAGVNRPDVIQRKGYYPAPKGAIQNILGLEVSGVITEIGKNVYDWKVGDKVCALIAGGGYSEYVAADAGSCLPIPKNIALDEAAALPEVLFTVWHNVFQRGNLQNNETVLIYGGSGGIGSMAIQLANIYGAKVITTASSEEKIQYCINLGAQKVINYTEYEVADQIEENAIDVILDSIGEPYLASNLDILKEDGRLVYINAMEGRKAELDIMKLMRKRLLITGSTLRARSLNFKKELAEAVFKNAYPIIESEAFKNMVNYKFKLKEADKAHRLMESRDFVGKIILTA